MGSMKVYWDKAPRDLIALAWSKRWSSDNPAPDIVGYLLAGAVIREGGSIPIRTLKDHCGWTKHRAVKVLARLRSDIGADKGRTDSDIEPDNRSPANQRFRDGEQTISDIEPDNRRTISDIARDPSLEKREETDQKKTSGKPDAIPVQATWDQLVALFAEHRTLPLLRSLNPKRRKALRARIKASSPEEVLAVCAWALTSTDGRARFLRDGQHGIDTLLSTKFDQYAEFAAMAAPSSTPSNGVEPVDRMATGKACYDLWMSGVRWYDVAQQATGGSVALAEGTAGDWARSAGKQWPPQRLQNNNDSKSTGTTNERKPRRQRRGQPDTNPGDFSMVPFTDSAGPNDDVPWDQMWPEQDDG